MPEGADQPAMHAQLDYGAMSVEQMQQRLVQGISGCEDREVLARMCALLEGSSEATSVAPPHNEGTVQAIKTPEGERKSAPRSSKKVDFVCSNPDGCEHCLKTPAAARRPKWKEMAWWRDMLEKTEGPIDKYVITLPDCNAPKEWQQEGPAFTLGRGKLDELLQDSMGDRADEEKRRFGAEKGQSTCPTLCCHCFHHYVTQRQKKDPSPQTSTVKRKSGGPPKATTGYIPKKLKSAASAQPGFTETFDSEGVIKRLCKEKRRRWRLYDNVTGLKTPLNQARSIQNLEADPLSNDSWAPLFNLYTDMQSVKAEVLASLPKPEAEALLYDARTINSMLWRVLAVAMADRAVDDVEVDGDCTLLGEHGQKCLHSTRFGGPWTDLSASLLAFGLSENDIANGTDQVCTNFADPISCMRAAMPIHPNWARDHNVFALVCVLYRVVAFRHAKRKGADVKLWDPQLTRDPDRRKVLEDRYTQYVIDQDLLLFLGQHPEMNFSYEHVARCLAETPEHAAKLVQIVTKDCFGTSWIWAHIRTIALARRAIYVLYDDEDYEALSNSCNEIHFLQRSETELYPSCGALDLGRQTWDATIIHIFSDYATPLDSVRRAREDDGDYRFYYMYASPDADLTGPLFWRKFWANRWKQTHSLCGRMFSIFDNLLFATSPEKPGTLEWIQTVDPGQTDPVCRCTMKSGRGHYESGRPLFHEISGTKSLWFNMQDRSHGFVVAVPSDVTIVGSDMPTLCADQGGWRSPVFVSSIRSTIAVYAVFNQYDYLKDREENTPITMLPPSDVDIRLFKAEKHSVIEASTPSEFVSKLEALAADMVRSQVLEGVHNRDEGTGSTDRLLQPHLLPKFRAFHGFLFQVSKDVMPSCVQDQCESVAVFKERDLQVPLRSYLEVPFDKVCSTIQCESVWWHKTPM